jgi:hypothetical protein
MGIAFFCLLILFGLTLSNTTILLFVVSETAIFTSASLGMGNSMKKAGMLVGGKNVVEVDSACCKIMGIAPSKVMHIKMASETRS